jgi:puromycin-sensitive aminopeptidase
LPGKVEWALLNEGGSGFFRVRYSPELLHPLTEHRGGLKPIERFGLVSDTWAATQAGLKPFSEYIEMARGFRDETDLNVWRALLGGFNYLDIIVSEQQRAELAKAVREMLAPAASRLGWKARDNEDELRRQLRGTVLANLGTLGEDRQVRERSNELYGEWTRDPAKADRDLVPPLINILAYSGDTARYHDFKQRFKNARTPQEEQRYLFSLAAFREPALLRETMAMTLNGEVRTQNAPFLMHSLLANPVCRYDAWEFLKTHWEEMISKYPDSALPRMCEAVVALLDKESEVNAFFEHHKPRLGHKIIDQHLEKLAVAVAFRNREGAKLSDSLRLVSA